MLLYPPFDDVADDVANDDDDKSLLTKGSDNVGNLPHSEPAPVLAPAPGLGLELAPG